MHSLVSFVINSILLGVGLAMDAFSVSMANGLNAPKMSRSMRIMIPLTFAVFQFLMPVIGWFCVRSCCRGICLFPVCYPVDCADTAPVHRRKDADRGHSRR